MSEPDIAMDQLRSMILELGSVDLFVISSGTGHENPRLDRDTIATIVLGFAAMANVAVEHLASCGSGTLVGISSIAVIRGNGCVPAYGATKAFVSHYLDALRHKFAKLGAKVIVHDVKPGFVDRVADMEAIGCRPSRSSAQGTKLAPVWHAGLGDVWGPG